MQPVPARRPTALKSSDPAAGVPCSGGHRVRRLQLTEVLYAIASLVQGSGIKFEADDGEDDDGEQHQQPDLQQRGHCFDDRLEHHLQTWRSAHQGKAQKTTTV